VMCHAAANAIARTDNLGEEGIGCSLDVLDLESPSSDCVKPTRTDSFMRQVWERMGNDQSVRKPQSISKRKILRIPFWLAVSGSISSSFLIACSAGFILTSMKHEALSETSKHSFGKLAEEDAELGGRILSSLMDAQLNSTLMTVENQVDKFIIELPDRAVDGLWTHMRAVRKFGFSAHADSWEGRRQLQYAAWAEVGNINPHRIDVINRANGLAVAFSSGAYSAVMTGKIKQVDSGSPNTSMATWFEMPPCSSSDECRLQKWTIDSEGDPGVVIGTVSNHVPSNELDIYKVQSELARRNPDGEVIQAWSHIHRLTDSPVWIISWTSPLAYCGNYSCMEGVLAASVRLDTVSYYCQAALAKLRWALEGENFSIADHNAAVFIVSQRSFGDSPDHIGKLIASSSARNLSSYLPDATEADDPIVSMAAKAIRLKYGSFRAQELQGQQPLPITFDQRNGEPVLLEEPLPFHLACSHCQQVKTLSVALDDYTSWLVVIVLPAGAFRSALNESAEQVEDLFLLISTSFETTFNELRYFNGLMFVVIVVVGVVIGLCLSTMISRELCSLVALMSQLERLDFNQQTPEFLSLLSGHRALIKDVSHLQDAFCRLAISVRAFARFVPESVVKNIVRGNEKCLELHVRRREVTVMFSDIKNFTTIAEALPEPDLLYLLTRYLTEMTNIIEAFGGVVTEILGDGILAFWNTPDDVPDHASMACAAAIQQQEALVALNREFGKVDVPKLSIRIGLHTGQVLSGNLGSERKMKFGCMGDTVNLANRLEDLCKRYGAGIICSSSTYSKLNPDGGFLCRRLDRVQVKGRHEATEILEVLGYETTPPGWRTKHARLYEEALSAYQAADFQGAADKVKSVLQVSPRDEAALNLQSRVQKCLGLLEEHDSEWLKTWDGLNVMTEK